MERLFLLFCLLFVGNNFAKNWLCCPRGSGYRQGLCIGEKTRETLEDEVHCVLCVSSSGQWTFWFGGNSVI